MTSYASVSLPATPASHVTQYPHDGLPDTTPRFTCQSCRRRCVAVEPCRICQSVEYCSAFCQVEHFRSHRIYCPSLALSFDPAVMLATPRTGLLGRHDKPFLQLMSRTYLHGRPAADVYALLIDMYRLSLHDSKWPWDQPEHLLPVVLQSPQEVAAGLELFLKNALLDHSALLPDWWDSVHMAHCMRVGWDVRMDNYYSFLQPSSVASIAEHYGHPLVPLQLRILKEQFDGAPFSDDRACDFLEVLVERESSDTVAQYQHSLVERLKAT
ncbi:hypothetical protein BROUX41_002092 [Berkeleyomyces rouxiae]|uniref:uncharacterized protein n=1 Tax=Berkeleyomyces rouxiae TaxID=2035830 RepID=UPI003B796500